MNRHIAHLRTNVVYISPPEPPRFDPYWTWLLTLLIDSALWALIIVGGLAFLRGTPTQPDLVLTGPITTIDPPITAQLAFIQSQFPQASPPVWLNDQGTLAAFTNFPFTHAIVWAPLLDTGYIPAGPLTYRYSPDPEPIPGVPEPATWQLVVIGVVVAFVLLWLGERYGRI